MLVWFVVCCEGLLPGELPVKKKHLLVAVISYIQQWNEKLVPGHCSVGIFRISWDILVWLLIQSMTDDKINSLQGFVEKLKWINSNHQGC